MTGAEDDDMPEDGITAEVFITEPSDKAPDVFGVGEVSCSCGGLRWTNITGSQCSMTSECPYCHEVLEVVPRPA